MASTWFEGGQRALYQYEVTGGWGSALNLRASVVNGTSISVQRNWLTIADFKGSNSLIANTEVELPVPPNRGSGWASGINGYEYWYNEPLKFGVIAATTPMAGIVVYEGAESTGSGRVWFCAEQAGGHEVSNGGDYSWGSAGKNVAAEMRCLAINNRYTFQGSLDILDNEASIWADSGWRIGYALIEASNAVTPLRQWRLMSELGGYPIVYCTAASPGHANMPFSIDTDREGPSFALNSDGDYFEYGIKESASRTPITWASAGGLQAGEVVTAVLAFAYQDPYNAAAARVIHWDDVANHTIQAAQDVTYGQTSSFTMNRVNL